LQHDRVRVRTPPHACRVFPEPGVAGSIPAGGHHHLSCSGWHWTPSSCSGRFRVDRVRAGGRAGQL